MVWTGCLHLGLWMRAFENLSWLGDKILLQLIEDLILEDHEGFVGLEEKHLDQPGKIKIKRNTYIPISKFCPHEILILVGEVSS